MKGLSKFIRIFSFVLVIIIALTGVLVVSLNLPFTQEFISRRVNQLFINKSLPIRIGSIERILPFRLQVRDVLIISAERDTLIYAESLNTIFSPIGLVRSTVDLDKLELSHLQVQLSRMSEAEGMDIARAFSPSPEPKPAEAESGKKQWTIRIGTGNLNDVGFQLTDIPGGLKITQQLDGLRMARFSLSLGQREIQLGTLELVRSEGGIILSGKSASGNKDPGAPWNYGFREISMEALHFRFDNTVDSLLIDLQIKEGDIQAREADIAGKSIDLDHFRMSGARAALYSSSSGDRQAANGSSGAGKTATGPGSGSALQFPWDIRGKDFSISRANIEMGSYPVSGDTTGYPSTGISKLALEVPRFHISQDDLALRLENLEFASSELLALDKMSMDLTSEPGSTRLDLAVKTLASQLNLEGEADRFLLDLLKDPEGTGQTTLTIREGIISPGELALLKDSLQEAPWFQALAGRPLLLSGDFGLDGPKLKIGQFSLRQSERFEIHLNGTIAAPFQPDQSEMALQLEVPALNPSWFGGLLNGEKMGDQVFSWSRLTLEGQFSGRFRSPAFDLALESDAGNLMASGNIDMETRTYALRSEAQRVLLGEWLSAEEIGAFSGSLDLSGRGFKPEELESSADLTIDSLDFRGYPYTGIRVTGQMQGGIISLGVLADDPALQSDISATLQPFGTSLEATAEGSIAARLNELKLYPDSLYLANRFRAQFRQSEQGTSARLQVDDLTFELPGESAIVDTIQMEFTNDSSGTRLLASSDFFNIQATIGISPDSLASLERAYQNYIVNIIKSGADEPADRIRQLPAMEVNTSFTYHKVLGILAADTSLWFSNLHFQLSNNLSDQSLHYQISGRNLEYSAFRVNSLEATLLDSAGTFDLQVTASDNRILDTPVRKINLTSRISGKESETALLVIDRYDETVYQFDLVSNVDSNQVVIGVPSGQLVFNKETWQMPEQHLVTIDLESGDILPEFTLQHDRSEITMTSGDSLDYRKYLLGLKEVELSSILVDSILPGHPGATFSGDLSYQADSLKATRIRSDLLLSGVAWSGLAFDSVTIAGELDSPQPGNLNARLEALLDSSDLSLTIQRQDSLLQSANARFNKLPISIAQPFVKQYLNGMKGDVSGSVNINPEGSSEQFAGGLAFHNASMRVVPLNSVFRIRGDSLSFRNNRLIFNQFDVLDTLNNDLRLDGYVDFANRRSPVANLEISSSRIQVMNRSGEVKGPLYGSAYVDSRLTIRGPVKNPTIKGRLQLTGGSELYYRETEDLSLSESERIITFVSDTTTGPRPPALPGSRLSQSGRTSIETTLEVDPSTKLHFNLSKRIYNIGMAIRGGGSLSYQMEGRNQMSLSGRYQINEGNADVKIIGWPNKSFDITEGGYVQWDGRVEDPELNLQAVNSIRTSYVNPVDGKYREVDFNVVLKVTDKLSNLTILFNVNTPDQYLMSIINTLSPEEQMRQAITVLLFEKVDLPGISTNTNYMTEQVNQLLASQLNQIAKASIQGVDVSFGIDSYRQATAGGGEETKTSLSYDVSKSFMNDRAQIEVSGRLNDLYNQPGASDFSLNNISFEYRLDSAGTKYLKVYNKHQYEDVFEGEVISTGVGFTYRKRYSRLSDIWKRNLDEQRKVKNK